MTTPVSKKPSPQIHELLASSTRFPEHVTQLLESGPLHLEQVI